MASHCPLSGTRHSLLSSSPPSTACSTALPRSCLSTQWERRGGTLHCIRNHLPPALCEDLPSSPHFSSREPPQFPFMTLQMIVPRLLFISLTCLWISPNVLVSFLKGGTTYGTTASLDLDTMNACLPLEVCSLFRNCTSLWLKLGSLGPQALSVCAVSGLCCIAAVRPCHPNAGRTTVFTVFHLLGSNSSFLSIEVIWGSGTIIYLIFYELPTESLERA